MLKPKVNALFKPCERESLFLVKKETVIGNIGNTQGVSTAINPPSNAKIKKPRNDSCLSVDWLIG